MIIAFNNQIRFPSKTRLNTPLANYNVTDSSIYKYKTPSKVKIGTSQRPSLSKTEKYSYYNHKDIVFNNNITTNLLNQSRFNNLKGGSIGISSREDNYINKVRAQTPGPDYYNTSNLDKIKKRPPSYYISEKCFPSSLINQSGTSVKVGPGRYSIINKVTSIHKSVPIYSFTKDVKSRRSKENTKNQSYFMYSSLGKQAMSMKRSENKISVGKESRGNSAKGVYKAHMSFQPVKVNIPMPSF